MDMAAIWEENKRWILWVLGGFIVWLIADSVIQGMYQSDARSKITRAVKKASGELYNAGALQAAQSEGEDLTALQSTLTQGLVFAPSPRFGLAGQSDPFLHFSEVHQSVRETLLDRTDALGIELLEKDIQVPSPGSRDEVAQTLVGLALMEQAANRLFAAHEAVHSMSDDASGVVGIESLKLGSGVRGRSTRRPSRIRRGSRAARAGAEDRVTEQRLTFEVRADAATVRNWLERCHSEQPPIALGTPFKMTGGRSPGDPVTVKGVLTSVQVRAD